MQVASCYSMLLLLLLLLLLANVGSSQKVAIIGGGITGTFTSKYLVDYDGKKCQLDSITIFDPNNIGEVTKSTPATTITTAPTTPVDNDWQGSRVAAIKLEDGRVVEIGASVFHEANHLVKEMIDNDNTLEIGKPFNVGRNVPLIPPRGVGLGIYDGDGAWAYMSNSSDPWNTFWTIVRYNLDLYKVDRATQRAVNAFASLPAILNSTDPSTFFESPDDMWKRVKLFRPVHTSFDRMLDAIGVSTRDSWIRKIIPYQGSLRAELLTAINLINYNQGNAQINGLVGLASFAASQGPLYSVVGGNYQIIQSAFRQAQMNRQMNCPAHETEKKEVEDEEPLTTEPTTGVIHQKKRVTSVIGTLEGFILFSGDEEIGTFDSLILAAPLQQCRITFLTRSHVDGAVLHTMPLADGMVDPEILATDGDHEGHPALPKKLPPCATKKFTQVVSTVITKARLNHEYFALPSQEKLPRAVCTTERAKAKEHNITVISEIAGDGVYKIFSSNVLENEYLTTLFGPDHKVEYTKVWGGQHGGATPDYRGEGKTVKYLLFDGATGLGGHTNKGALYYPNAIESALACMEASAVGAKSVAKLVARRLKLITPSSLPSRHDGEEL